MQEEVRRIARTSGHITHGDAVKLEHAADLIEAQAAQLQEAREAHAALWRALAGIIECPGVSPNATVRRMAAMAESALINDKLAEVKPMPRFLAKSQ
jgi:hypothetical protein